GVQSRLADAAERLRFDGGLSDTPERHEAIGQAGYVDAPALDPHVGDRALEQLGGDARGALADLARRARHRRARVGGDAAATRAHPEGKERRVARDHLNVVERRTELFRRDLGERRRVSLALSRHADEHVDLATRVDADGGALEGPEPRALRVAAEADAQTVNAARALFLLPPPVVVAEERERALERGGEIARVIGDGDAVLVREPRTVWHLVGTHEI